jgi:hypothetical protein
MDYYSITSSARPAPCPVKGPKKRPMVMSYQSLATIANTSPITPNVTGMIGAAPLDVLGSCHSEVSNAEA